MKKIGFIDFFLDEWHANSYPEWIRENCSAKGRDMELAYAYADTGRQGGLDTAAWCGKYGAEPLGSIEELVEKSDYIVVLSPDNPEHHERLSGIPLMSGKPVYVDKTFSPDLATGVRMFELAGRYGTPMFSSSALRFSKELAAFQDNKAGCDSIEYAATLGPGRYENYSVHQLEMIVALMGAGAKRIKGYSGDNSRQLIIEYPDGRRASMNQIQSAPFQVSIQLKNGDGAFIGQCSDMFTQLVDSILDFFETGRPSVLKEETLEIMALIEAGYKALKQDDTWIGLK